MRGFLEEYAATDDGKRLLDSFLSGLIAAYGWSNVTLKRSLRRIFVPRHGGERIKKPIRIIRRMASENTKTLDAPVGAALLTNLKRRYPCRELPELKE